MTTDTTEKGLETLIMRHMTGMDGLADRGYVTISPDDRRFIVSQRLKDDYENGRTYYALHGTELRLPADARSTPRREFLEWHATVRFRG